MLDDGTEIPNDVFAEALNPDSFVNKQCPRTTTTKPSKKKFSSAEQILGFAEKNEDVLRGEWGCKGCPWQVNSPKHLDCGLMVISTMPKDGSKPYLVEDIAVMENVTVERVKQLITNALTKGKQKLSKLENFKELEKEYGPDDPN